MSPKTINITGWVLSAVLGIIFAMSAFMKLTQNETAIEQAALFGIDANTYFWIGIVEIVSLILFLVPRTGLIGSLLLIAYLGGAIVTHLQHQDSIAMAVVIQIILWITAAFRFPELSQSLFSSSKP